GSVSRIGSGECAVATFAARRRCGGCDDHGEWRDVEPCEDLGGVGERFSVAGLPAARSLTVAPLCRADVLLCTPDKEARRHGSALPTNAAPHYHNALLSILFSVGRPINCMASSNSRRSSSTTRVTPCSPATPKPHR